MWLFRLSILSLYVLVHQRVVVDARVIVRLVADVVVVVCHVDRLVDSGIVAVICCVDCHVCRRVERCIVRRVVRGTRNTP